jgi:hypothetical protein
MRAASRFALAVFLALVAADTLGWTFLRRTSLLDLVHDLLLAAVAYAVVRLPGDRSRVVAALAGALAAETLLLVVSASATSPGFDVSRCVLTIARVFGILLAGRGETRWIDGLLVAVPVVVADFIVTAVSALYELGERFSVGAVTPHLGQVLAWGVAVSVVVPLVAGRRKAV